MGTSELSSMFIRKYSNSSSAIRGLVRNSIELTFILEVIGYVIANVKDMGNFQILEKDFILRMNVVTQV